MAQVGFQENDAIFAEEDFVVELQTVLHGIMERENVSRADLARKMGVSRARITQIFSDDCKNFTVRLLARAAHALGERLVVETESSQNKKMCGRKLGNVLGEAEVESFWKMQNDFTEIKKLIPSNDQNPKRLIGYEAFSLEWEAA